MDPPPPGVDPEFDALVEAELARRRAVPPKGVDPVFDSLVEAEMDRQRKELEAISCNDDDTTTANYDGESYGGESRKETRHQQQPAFEPRDNTRHHQEQRTYELARDDTRHHQQQRTYELARDDTRREQERELARDDARRQREQTRGARDDDTRQQREQTYEGYGASSRWQQTPFGGLGSYRRDPYERAPLGRGMATLQGVRPAQHFGGRRDAQAAYAAELRKQIDEKKEREKLEREREVAASRERLAAASPRGDMRTTRWDDEPPLRGSPVGQPATPPRVETTRSPRSAARCRFVRDVYGETNVAGALGGAYSVPPERVTRPRDADHEARRRAQALAQKAALEAQMEERRAKKKWEEDQRRAEDERELRERVRFEAAEKKRKEAEDAKRKADEQRRFDDLLAQQEAAAARRKHLDVRRDEPPAREHYYQEAAEAALDVASSQFEEAVANEVTRLRVAAEKHQQQPRHPYSLAALAKRYDQNDPASLSFLARQNNNTTKQRRRDEAGRVDDDDDDDWGEKSLAGNSNFVPVSPLDDEDAAASPSRSRPPADEDDLVARWQRQHPVVFDEPRHRTPDAQQLRTWQSSNRNNDFGETAGESSLAGESRFGRRDEAYINNNNNNNNNNLGETATSERSLAGESRFRRPDVFEAISPHSWSPHEEDGSYFAAHHHPRTPSAPPSMSPKDHEDPPQRRHLHDGRPRAQWNLDRAYVRGPRI